MENPIVGRSSMRSPRLQAHRSGSPIRLTDQAHRSGSPIALADEVRLHLHGLTDHSHRQSSDSSFRHPPKNREGTDDFRIHALSSKMAKTPIDASRKGFEGSYCRSATGGSAHGNSYCGSYCTPDCVTIVVGIVTQMQYLLRYPYGPYCVPKEAIIAPPMRLTLRFQYEFLLCPQNSYYCAPDLQALCEVLYRRICRSRMQSATGISQVGQQFQPMASLVRTRAPPGLASLGKVSFS
jgi:hypothetical protein